MLVTFFDTEATGLCTGKRVEVLGRTSITELDDVIQLGMISYDTDSKQFSIVNKFFETDKAISFNAQAVHGISRMFLKTKSGGVFFEEYADTLREINRVWVGFNNSVFDQRLINNGLEHRGFKPIDFGEKVLSLDFLDKSKSYHIDLRDTIRGTLLEKVREFYFSNQIERYFSQFVSEWGDGSGYSVHAHDAVYDSFLCLLLFSSRYPEVISIECLNREG